MYDSFTLFYCRDMKLIHFPVVLHVVGYSLMFEGLFMLLNAPVALWYADGQVIPQLAASIVTMLSAVVMLHFSKYKSQEPNVRESIITVPLAWLLVCLYGTLPYLFGGGIPRVENALFESVSGFTTTGSTILNNIEALPKSLLFWRAQTHWIGGMGIIVLVIAILPSLKVAGSNLFSAEGSFFSTEKIRPRLIDVAKRLWYVYVALTFIETVCLRVAGMEWFDAICHSYATIATGGFSTFNTSLIDVSPAIQYIATVFMALSGVNFALHYFIINRQFRKVVQNEEWRIYFIIILVVSLVLTFTNMQVYNDVETSFRHAVFQVVSIITATGFSSADYELWPHISMQIIFVIMFIGACVGSTGGGIKVGRYIVVVKSVKRQFQKILHPNSVSVMTYNKQPVSQTMLLGISAFVVIYFLTFLVGTFVMLVLGLDIPSATSSVITTLGGIGPGFGVVGPVKNFETLTLAGKLYLSFNMILGRLEILSVLSLLYHGFYKV